MAGGPAGQLSSRIARGREPAPMQLELPWRAEFGHHRYLLDAVQ